MTEQEKQDLVRKLEKAVRNGIITAEEMQARLKEIEQK